MKSLLPLLLALIGSLLFAGCGKNERSGAPADGAPAGTAPSTVPAESDAAPAPESRVIAITGNDTMKFSLTEIRAQPGEMLSVTLNNIGTMPKAAMGHNWVLLKGGVDANRYAGEAATAAGTDYLPPSQQDNVIAATRLLGPKETDTVTFQAPTEPGRYVYLCSFPGHFQVGMKGVLIVE